jgi:hypothetical protein
MAPTYRNIATLGGSSGTSAAISKPSGVVDDDVMLAYLHVEGTKALTPPSGWTLIDSRPAGSTFTDYLYWKRAASEGSSYTWSWSGNAWREGFIYAAQGCITGVDPWDAWSEADGDGSTTTWPGVTTAGADRLLVMGAANWFGGGWTPGSGQTERYDGGGSNNLVCMELAQAGAGASGDKTATGAGGSVWVGHLIALKPPAGDVEVTDVATAVLTVVDPTVQLGSLSLTDVAINVLGVVDPTVQIAGGGQQATDVAALVAGVVDPTVVLGSLSLTDVAVAFLAVVDPAVQIAGGAEVAGHVDCADAGPTSATGSDAAPTSCAGLDAAPTSAVGGVAVV